MNAEMNADEQSDICEPLKCACAFFVQLAYCIVQFLEKDPTLAEVVCIKFLLYNSTVFLCIIMLVTFLIKQPAINAASIIIAELQIKSYAQVIMIISILVLFLAWFC